MMPLGLLVRGPLPRSKGQDVQLDWNRQDISECNACCKIVSSLGNVYFK